MTAKQYLRQVRRLDDIVNAKLEQVTELRSLATKMTSTPRLDAVQSSGEQDKISAVVAKIVDLEHDINRTVDELIDLKAEAIVMIDSIPNDDYRLLLTLRYLNFKTWEQIAVDMNYSYQWVHVLHSRALINFGEMFPEKFETVDSN